MPSWPFVPSWLFEALQAIRHPLAHRNQLGWPAPFWVLVALLGAFMVARVPPPPDTRCPLDCRRYPGHKAPSWLVGSRHISDCSAPSCQLSALMDVLRLSRCSSPYWLLGALLCYPTSSWSPALSWMLSTLLAAQCSHTHSSYSLPPGTLVVTRPTSGSPARSCPLDALLVTQQFPVFCRPSSLGALTEGTE